MTAQSSTPKTPSPTTEPLPSPNAHEHSSSLGKDIPAASLKNLQVAFDYGHENEDMVLEMGERRFGAIVNRQAEVRIGAGTDKIWIVGHIDGEFLDHTAEVKCLNHENTEKFLNDPLSFRSYMVQSFLYATGRNKSATRFLIYDKDEKELKTLSLATVEMSSLTEVMTLVAEREAAWSRYQSTDELPNCTTSTFCPYYYLHEDDLIDDPSLEDAMASLVAIQNRVAAFQKLEEIQKAVVKNRLTELALAKGRVGKYKFSFSTFTTRRLDTKRVTEFLQASNLAGDYTNVTTGTRLEVKEVDDAITTS